MWYLSIQIYFVYSRAQQLLANPEYQSNKFLDAFITEPYPRMVEDPLLVLNDVVEDACFKEMSRVGALRASAPGSV